MSSAKDTASTVSAPEAPWNAGIPGTCFELQCTGANVAVKNAGECPADRRYFRQSVPGGVCQHLPPK